MQDMSERFNACGLGERIGLGEQAVGVLRAASIRFCGFALGFECTDLDDPAGVRYRFGGAVGAARSTVR